MEWIGRVGHGGHAVFGQKLLNTKGHMSSCTHKSPIIKWANVLSLPKNNSLKPNAASHNASWYTDTDGFPEHSPSGGSLYYKGPALQKIIPFYLGPTLYIFLGTTCRHSDYVGDKRGMDSSCWASTTQDSGAGLLRTNFEENLSTLMEGIFAKLPHSLLEYYF